MESIGPDRPRRDWRWPLRAAAAAIAALSCSSGGGGGASLEADPLATGGLFVSVGTIVGDEPSDQVTLDLTVYVVDATGAAVDDLEALDFAIESFTTEGVEFDFTQTDFAADAPTPLGAASAYLLIDQSASIRDSDPSDHRADAATRFLAGLEAGDEVSVGAFTDSATFYTPPVEQLGPFTGDGSALTDAIDALADQEGGNTPLYQAALQATDDTAAQAARANRAVVLLTDGVDSVGGATLDDVIDNAALDAVQLFAVGLGDEFDDTELAAMAFGTGGAYSLLGDPLELLSLYGSLGDVLRGEVVTYRLEFALQTSEATLEDGGLLRVSLTVDLGESRVDVPFVAELLLPPAG